jgi:enoyl-CoA hydratase
MPLGRDLGFTLEKNREFAVLNLVSDDNMNRLTRAKIQALHAQVGVLLQEATHLPLIISGQQNFSAGADLNEINRVGGPVALAFAIMGQALMAAVEGYPGRVYATITGFCMGGGLDLALACRYRIASPHAVFGHRGAALGLITGWGGTQRLPRLIGKGRALEMFVTAEKLSAETALRIGLIDAIASDPTAEAIRRIKKS